MKSLTPTHGRPACPSHLSSEAKAEWDRVVEELDAMGTLATADRAVLAIHCMAWARWLKAEKEIEATNEVVPSPKEKTPMYSIWLNVSKQAQDRIVETAKELGLTPRARRLMGGTGEEKDERTKAPNHFADL